MALTRTLGILVAKKAQGLRYGELDQLCRELIAMGDFFGWTVYAFSPQDIESGGITAWRFNEAKHLWYCENRVEPQVLYDRLLISGQGRRDATLWIQAAQKRGLLLINTMIGDKYKVHQLLYTSPLLAEHLPNSAMVRSVADIERWLRVKKSIYIKPVNGTQGKGVLRVTSDDLQPRKILYKNGKGLMMQEEIKVHLHQGRRADLRCFMQQDQHGNWQLTFTGVRLGKVGSDTSNLHQGGDALHSETYLRFLPINRRVRLFEELFRLNCEICTLLERRYGSIGELGIDWGIDEDGKPWLIEVNSKPGRRLMGLLGAEAERLLSFRRVLECAELRLNTAQRRVKKSG